MPERARGLGRMPEVSETREAVRGRSDEEILAWIESVGGVEAFLGEAFAGMRDAFQADRARGQSVVIGWDIDTPGGQVASYQLLVDEGVCSVEPGRPESPRVTLAIDLANFLRLLVGTLDGRDARDAGTLRIHGEQRVAALIREWFRAPD